MKPLRYLPALLLVVLMVADSCKKFDLNTDDLDLGLNLDIIKTNFEIVFKDAASGKVVNEDDQAAMSVTVHGPDSAWVVDPSGERYAEYTPMSGRVALSLDPYNAKPTEEDPVIFVLYVEAEGYMAASKRIETIREGTFYDEILLIRVGNPPSGAEVKTVVDAGRAEGGRVTETIEVETDKGSAGIRIPAGTVLHTATGVALEGPLKVVLSNFSVSDNESRKTFPGGFIGMIDSASVQRKAGLDPAAFFNVEISDSQNRNVHRVSNGSIEVRFSVDPVAINPKTNLPYQAGDEISWYSFNEPEAIWKFEGVTRVTQSGAALQARANLPHLTWFQGGGPINFHYQSRSFGFKSDDLTTLNRSVHYKIMVYYWLEGQWVYGTQNFFDGYPLPVNSYMITAGFPEDRRFYFVAMRWLPFKLVFENDDRSCGDPVYSYWNTPAELSGEIPRIDGSGGLIVPIHIAPAAEGSQSEAVIHIKIRCTDSRKIVYPSQRIYARYREVGSTCWIYRWVESGKTVIPGIRPGATYEVQASYSKKWQPTTPYLYTISSNYQPRTRIDVTFEIGLKCD